MRCALQFLFLIATAALAQEFTYTPERIRQGETLKLHAPPIATKARLNGITIPLFLEPDGAKLGLMPVGVEQETGDFKLEFLDTNGAVVYEITVTIHDAHY